MKNFLVLTVLTGILVACGSSSKKVDPASIDRDGIKKTILTERKSIRDCYGKELAKKGSENLSGKIVVNFDINEEGKAQNANVLPAKSTIKNKSLSDCIIAQLQTWKFPAPPNEQVINVSYPFSFNDTPARNMQQKMDQYKKLKDNKPTK